MNMTPYKDQIVWIIGASSGIGSALAQLLSTYHVTLALSARRKDKLDVLKDQLGDRHKVFAFDISDAKQTVRTAQAIRATFGRIDRVIFLAAAYQPMTMDSIDLNLSQSIIEVNLIGAFNIIHAVWPILKEQPIKGQIALCGSVAGYIGLPGGQPYSATKAAIINLAESLHAEGKGRIDIKLISPGFVRTPLTDKNDFNMPMMIEPEQAAKAIAKGLLGRHFEVHFPKRLTLLLKILRLLPYPLSLRLTQRIKT